MRKGDMIFGAVMMLLAVMLGAFGAHKLKVILSPEHLESFKTGVRYQMVHALALILFAFSEFKSLQNRKLISGFFKIGIILFSVSIYLLTLSHIIDMGSATKILGPITPIGGICLIGGWILVISSLYGLKSNR